MIENARCLKAVWAVLERLFAAWQRDPYRWANERDIQAALAGRLFARLDSLGVGHVVATNEEDDWSGLGKQTWGRVACEPPVYTGATKRIVKPDVVVWDAAPPTDDTRRWPILWACELKYIDRAAGGGDLRKLRGMLSPKGTVRSACAVEILRDTAKRGNGVSCQRLAGGRLRHYTVRLRPK
jgi:hypothetical protein